MLKYTKYCYNKISSVVVIFAVTLAMCMTGTEKTAAEIDWRCGAYANENAENSDVHKTLIALSEKGQGQHLVIQFSRPLERGYRGYLAEKGIHLLNYLGDNAFFACIKNNELTEADLDGITEIVTVSAIRPEWKMAPTVASGDFPDYAVSIHPETNIEMVAAYVLFHRDVQLSDHGFEVVEKQGGEVVDDIISVNGLVVEIPRKNLRSLADEDEVMWIEPPLPILEPCNNSNRSLTQANAAQSAPYNLDGSGVNVLVYDGGGVDEQHEDFGGRVTIRDNATLTDHATHVAGTIGGSGEEEDGLYRGMAPNVTMESYKFWWDTTGVGLYSNPGDLESDYDEAINTYGVHIANNSIGSKIDYFELDCAFQGNYGATSALIDNIVCGSLGEPFRIVWAAGNERWWDRCDVEGHGDYYSTAPPAGAKNHIAVGAVNSNDDSMTEFSSWGPVDDGRLKPDITAPGCQSNGDYKVTSCQMGGGYYGNCGTSMAAPTVTGCLALVLEDYRSMFMGQPDPRNSTLKILLAHNAVDLGNAGPDYQFGYGSVRVVDTIDFMRLGDFEEESVDQGENKAYEIDVLAGIPTLKVTMAWDDPAGTPNVIPSLVNDLDLIVTSPSGQRAYPWTLDPDNPENTASRNSADHINNIEQVLVDNPEAGTWTVEVFGNDIPEGPQVFSICASPNLNASGPYCPCPCTQP